jgi:hypothetical protein
LVLILAGLVGLAVTTAVKPFTLMAPPPKYTPVLPFVHAPEPVYTEPGWDLSCNDYSIYFTRSIDLIRNQRHWSHPGTLPVDIIRRHYWKVPDRFDPACW